MKNNNYYPIYFLVCFALYLSSNLACDYLGYKEYNGLTGLIRTFTPFLLSVTLVPYIIELKIKKIPKDLVQKPTYTYFSMAGLFAGWLTYAIIN